MTAVLTSVLEAAQSYVAAGLSVIPVGLDGCKQPAFDVLPRAPDPDRPDKMKASWKPFQERLPTEEELARWFGGRVPLAIAAVCGSVSGGLECLDFDDKGTAREFLSAVKAEGPGLYTKLSLEETPRGVHVWYLTTVREGNRALAGRPDGFDKNGRPKSKKVIETRGEGGYAVVAGSPLAAHELKLPYKHVGGPPLTAVEYISDSDRDYLFRLAMSFDREDRRAQSPAGGRARDPGELSPADDYDLRGEPFSEILTDAEFARPGKDEGNVTRPGKERGSSATVGHCKGERGEPLLKVFTSNWPPFEVGKVYGRFHALRLTRFRGDGAAAMRFLREKGYGSPAAGNGRRHAPTPEANGKHQESPPPASPGPEPWDQPIPLDDPADAAPPFPLDALPDPLAALCRDVGETIGCPPDYAAAFALATMSGTCGAAVALNVKQDWEEHASLFVCAVAPPNGGKTPSFKIVTRPVIEEQSRRFADGDKHPAYVGDITVEKLAEVLKDDPRGTLLLRDELAGWVKGMDQYKARGGSDRQFWLSAWSSDAVSVHRKNPDSPHVFIAHPCVSVAGGIQPEVLKSLKGNDDGFFDRILFSYPQTLPARPENWRSCDRRLVAAWSRALETVRGIELVSDAGRPARPRFVGLSDGAKREWEEFTESLAARINDPEFPPHLAGVAGKLKGYGARLGLVSMLLRAAYQPGGEVLDLGPGDMRNGAALAGYFLGHAMRVYRVMGRDPRIEQARKILQWLAAKQVRRFRRSDVWDSLRKGSVFGRPEDLSAPLWLLSQHRYVRSEQQDPTAGPGRRPTPTFEVNPHLFHRPINPINPINAGGGLD